MKREHHAIWHEMIVQGQLMRNRTHAVVGQIAAAHDITVQQLLVLLGIHNCQVATIGDVTRELELLQANASALCKRMEGLGYVARMRNEQDVRVVNVCLTSKGKSLVQEVVTDITQRFSHIQQENIDVEVIQNGLQELNRFMQIMEGNKYE